MVQKNYLKILSLSLLVLLLSSCGYLRKPEKEIYTYVLNKLKVNSNEILFIDDLGINLKPAREIGFQTYKFVDTKKTILYFKNLLNI